MVKAGSQGSGMRSMMDDVGISSNVKIITDATAARGMAQRKGLGAVRHVEVHQLWIQDKVQSKEICVEEVGDKATWLMDSPSLLMERTLQYMLMALDLRTERTDTWKLQAWQKEMQSKQ